MENLSKKQKKRLERMERKEDQSARDKRSRQTKSTMTWLVTLAIIAGIVWGLVLLVKNSSEKGEIVATSESINSEDWTVGSADSLIHLIEYSDFQCPACASYEPTLVQLMEEYKDDLYFAYRHFPLRSIHPHAQLVAQASEAAGLQGKFWEMHDKIFETQTLWASRPRIESFLSELATEIGLNVDRFESDLKSSSVKAAVDADYESAVQLRLNATPTFILNGSIIPNPSNIEAFRVLFDSILSAEESEATE